MVHGASRARADRHLLSRGSRTLEDSGLPHGIELLDGVVLLVEVSVGLLARLRYCILHTHTHAALGFLDLLKRKIGSYAKAKNATI